MVRTGLLIVFYRKKCCTISGGGSLPLAPNPRFSATPSAGWLCFFPPPSLHSAGTRFPCPQRPSMRVFTFFCEAKNGAFATKQKLEEQAAACDMPATPIGHEFLRFSARRKMGAVATKQKLEEQAPACDMPATPIKEQATNCSSKRKIANFLKKNLTKRNPWGYTMKNWKRFQ